ncbi:VOC family protein [Spirosoma pollinicola]|uniref:Glyoxalase n=1 Tax=Spirosoma pollinicola TaxID=2057025 RepID=A0A2K8Z869_9BACT|nr:VOC family protein [Spirosoma pollinicola]AUD06061.1 glyoxalase [Spirosoma pollinicola]
MQFSSIRIITADNHRLVQFYELVTGMTLTQHTDDFAELRTPSVTLAIASTRTSPLFGNNQVVTAASNRSVIIEFRVNDVDADYEKLVDILGESVIQKPTTMPWGNRSFLFRDPDGNLVNFFTPVTAESLKRADE